MLTRFQKIYKWEFWPYQIFYFPILIYWLWLSFKAKSLSFFTASNPGIELGGFAEYSKYKILKKINQKYLPNTTLIKIEEIQSLSELFLEKNNLKFPLIVKPNIGDRGYGVEKIKSFDELKKYTSKIKGDIIIQEFVDYPLEFGVMYYRYPEKNEGNVISVALKEFLFVEGDGKSTLEELIKKHYRAKFYKKILKQKYISQLDDIIPNKKNILLEQIGNHRRGTKFINSNNLINKKLINNFNKICLPIEGFYFGRFDLKAKCVQDLYDGENLKIMELNGAASEPAHIYDPDTPLIRAYKDLFKHWEILYKISIANKKLGIEYVPIKKIFNKIDIHLKNRINLK